MTTADLPKYETLSVDDKLDLLETLWIDVAREKDSAEVTPEEQRLLDERRARYAANPASWLVW